LGKTVRLGTDGLESLDFLGDSDVAFGDLVDIRTISIELNSIIIYTESLTAHKVSA
jgi:hypothetical protein